MALGFHPAFKAGISFGKDDMVVPAKKWKIVDETRSAAKDFEQQFNEGLITQGEKYNKVVDAWSKCTDKIAEEMMKEISAVRKDKETGREQPINSIYMMADSGARGSAAQMKQLAGMRGLMAKPSGEGVASLASRIVGRTVAEDLRDPGGTEVLVPRSTLLGEPEVDRIVQAGIQEVRIRSVLTCEAPSGVCAACYGRDLARGTPVNMGEAVGVIAAQSIGEPGTQLTMRTFHIGGAAPVFHSSFIELD